MKTSLLLSRNIVLTMVRNTRLDVWTDEQNKLTAMMHFVTEVIASNFDVKRSKFKVTVK